MTHNSTRLPGDRPVKKVTADVIFGKLSKDCQGVGICKVDVKGMARRRCRTCKFWTRAEIVLTASGQVHFHFPKSQLREEVRMKHLRRDEFVVPERFTFPAELLQALGLSYYSIKPGVYHIEEDDFSYHIRFQKQARPAHRFPSRVTYMLRRRRCLA